MDKVQIYTTALIMLNLMGHGMSIGAATDDEQGKKIFIAFFGILLSLPVYGRIFGIW